MKGEHEIGDSFSCDYCDFQSSDRSSLRKHIEEEHKTKYETCGGNYQTGCMQKTHSNVVIVNQFCV